MDDQERAKQADFIQKHPVMKEAFETLEKYYIDAMVGTEPGDVEGRNKWHSCVFALNDVKTTLTAFVQSGKIDAINESKREKVNDDG